MTPTSGFAFPVGLPKIIVKIRTLTPVHTGERTVSVKYFQEG